MNRISLLILLTLVFAWSSTGFAAQNVPTIDTSQPLEILSQQLEVFRQENRSVFSGDVVATQGDMTMTTDRLIVFFAGENSIERLEAVGHVKFTQLDRTATAEKMIYRQKEGTLLLIGNARVVQGPNQVDGDEITYFVNENRSVVKGSSQKRVKAVIVPQQKKDVE